MPVRSSRMVCVVYPSVSIATLAIARVCLSFHWLLLCRFGTIPSWFGGGTCGLRDPSIHPCPTSPPRISSSSPVRSRAERRVGLALDRWDGIMRTQRKGDSDPRPWGGEPSSLSSPPVRVWRQSRSKFPSGTDPPHPGLPFPLEGRWISFPPSRPSDGKSEGRTEPKGRPDPSLPFLLGPGLRTSSTVHGSFFHPAWGTRPGVPAVSVDDRSVPSDRFPLAWWESTDAPTAGEARARLDRSLLPSTTRTRLGTGSKRSRHGPSGPLRFRCRFSSDATPTTTTGERETPSLSNTQGNRNQQTCAEYTAGSKKDPRVRNETSRRGRRILRPQVVALAQQRERGPKDREKVGEKAGRKSATKRTTQDGRDAPKGKKRSGNEPSRR